MKWWFSRERPAQHRAATVGEADVLAATVVDALVRGGALRDYTEAGLASVRALILRTLTARP
jgi:hypothetical protein